MVDEEDIWARVIVVVDIILCGLRDMDRSIRMFRRARLGEAPRILEMTRA